MMFVFVNYSGQEELQQYHGIVIGIDSDDNHAPFPSLFIIHEMRVRGFRPFQPVQPELPAEPDYANWIDSEELWAYENDSFKRQKLPCRGEPRTKRTETRVQEYVSSIGVEGR